MTTRFFYFDVSTAVEVTEVNKTPEARAGGWPVISQLGEAGSGSVLIDDPNGTYDFQPWHKFFITEDTIDPSYSSSHERNRIWQGYVTDIKVSRGTYRTGAGRQWELTLTEKNNVLQQRIIRSTHGGNRPAETDIQRLNWWLSTGWAAGVVYTDLGYVDSTNPVDLDANDYTGQYFGEVLADLSNASGKNHFLLYHREGGGSDPTGHYDLYYADPFDDIFSSTVKVSDVTGDADDNTVFAPVGDFDYRSDPSRMYDGIFLQYNGGSVYYSVASDSGEIFRDGVAPASEVKTAAKANALAAREHGEVQEPDVTVSFTISIPTSRISFIRPGQRLQIKSSWMPDFSSYTWVRIREYTIRQNLGNDTHYDIDIVASPGEAAAGGGGGGAPTSCADNTPVLVDPGTYSFASHGTIYFVGEAVTLPSTLSCNGTAVLRDFNFSTTDSSKSMHISLVRASDSTFLIDFWSNISTSNGPYPRTFTTSVSAAALAPILGETVRFKCGVPIATASEITWSVGAGSGLFFVTP